MECRLHARPQTIGLALGCSAALALLGSCGGDGPGASASPATSSAAVPTATPAPTPTPTASAAPAPTPTPYPTIDGLSSTTALPSACAGIIGVSTPPTNTAAGPFGGGSVSIVYTPSPRAFTLSEAIANTFDQASLLAGSTAATENYAIPSGSTLSVRNPGNLYGRQFDWSFYYRPAAREYFCAAGIPTAAADQPAASALSQYDVGGVAYLASQPSTAMPLGASVVSVAVNAATRQAVVTIALNATSAGITTLLAQVTGSATLDPNATTFRGNLTSAARPNLTGSFSGSLLGSRGQEAALAFSVASTSAAEGPIFTAAGSVVAK